MMRTERERETRKETKREHERSLYVWKPREERRDSILTRTAGALSGWADSIRL